MNVLKKMNNIRLYALDSSRNCKLFVQGGYYTYLQIALSESDYKKVKEMHRKYEIKGFNFLNIVVDSLLISVYTKDIIMIKFYDDNVISLLYLSYDYFYEKFKQNSYKLRDL